MEIQAFQLTDPIRTRAGEINAYALMQVMPTHWDWEYYRYQHHVTEWIVLGRKNLLSEFKMLTGIQPVVVPQTDRDISIHTPICSIQEIAEDIGRIYAEVQWRHQQHQIIDHMYQSTFEDEIAAAGLMAPQPLQKEYVDAAIREFDYDSDEQDRQWFECSECGQMRILDYSGGEYNADGLWTAIDYFYPCRCENPVWVAPDRKDPRNLYYEVWFGRGFDPTTMMPMPLDITDLDTKLADCPTPDDVTSYLAQRSANSLSPLRIEIHARNNPKSPVDERIAGDRWERRSVLFR